MLKVNKLYSYIITHDTGFSPNPFYNILSLACCKPKIRISIGNSWNEDYDKGAWIIALSPKRYNKGNDIVYIMNVTECLTFEKYWNKYPEKRPDFSNSRAVFRRGDNIYKPDLNKDGGFIQLRSRHSINPQDDNNWREDDKSTKKDLSGKYVLLSDKFIYFGDKPIKLPSELSEIIPGRGHKCNFTSETLSSIQSLLLKYESEILAGTIISRPTDWPHSDVSWKE